MAAARKAAAKPVRTAVAVTAEVRASDITAPLPDLPPAPANDDGLPILLGYQGRWIEDPADVKIAEKSRRIGLTWAEAFDDVTIAARSRAAGGTNVFYIGYNFEMAREFISACAMWARHLHQAIAAAGEFVFRDVDDDGESRDIKAFRITFASGFSIIALPSRPRSLRGMQGVVIIDEAAFHDDLPGMLKAAMALLMWGGKVRIISTHLGTENPFNETVIESRQKRKPYSLHTITLDDALRDGLYRRICTSLGNVWTQDDEKAWRDGIIANYRPNDAEELFCIPSEGGGAYFPLAMLEAAQRDGVPVVRWAQTTAFSQQPDAVRKSVADTFMRLDLALRLLAIGRKHPAAIGVDFARSGDLTVIWVFVTLPDGSRRTALVVELRNVPFTEQEAICAFVAGNLNLQAMKLDATGNGAFLAERMQQRYGAGRVEAVKLSRDWYIEHFPRLRAGIEDRMTELPNDRDILADFRLVTMIDGCPRVSDKRSAGGDGGQRHGDAAIAAVLAFAASRAAPFKAEYERPDRKPRDRYEPNAERTHRLRMQVDEVDDEPRRSRVTW